MNCLLVSKGFSHIWLTIIPGAVGYHGSTNLDSILKSRDITLLTNVHLVKAIVFPVVMYGCESWTIKKSECQRMDAFLFYYFYFILLYNTVLVLAYTDMNPLWVYMSSQSWTPSHLPPHIISPDHPRAPAPIILYPISNIDWRFVSYLIVYMFQCCSPKSSHPLPLPHSPKVCSIHLCLFCCLAYRVIVTIFLNSIYMH